MAELAHYSPEDITVLFSGVHQLSGFADGTFVSITKDNPTYTTHESSDGVVSRKYNSSKVYTVKLTLANTSESNQVLTYAAALDAATQMGKFPLIIKDQLGSSLFFSLTSWIETLPDSSFSTSITGREWTIKCAQAVFNLGGNDSPQSLSQDALNVALGLAGSFI